MIICHIYAVVRVLAMENHRTDRCSGLGIKGLRVAMGVRRAVGSYCWIKKPVCRVVFEIQLPALLRMHDYSSYKCMVPVL